jgi:hypothetical protein
MRLGSSYYYISPLPPLTKKRIDSKRLYNHIIPATGNKLRAKLCYAQFSEIIRKKLDTINRVNLA